ncbi:unnamed protein product [Mytilus coruscus]|uniref:CCHC-type domain-containing protein n=1 Tax=Mytilus coruscus TaxID=42192 RepID=A0A6J8F3B6_MYTCO|nr:unnamed protein product [Mytilus coruscus]
MADYQFDSEIGLLKSVIEKLEKYLKQSFMHSASNSLPNENDSGITDGVELIKDIVVFGGVFAEKVTLPSTSDTRQNCYKCGEFGHFRSECSSPSQRHTNPCNTDEKVPSGKSGTARILTTGNQNYHVKSSASNIEEGGIYVNAVLNRKSCKFVVDTGATLSIVSYNLYESLRKQSEVELIDISQRMTSISGVGNESFKLEAVVADIKVDGILGQDFLKTNKCILDIVSEKLFLGESEINLVFERSLDNTQSLDQDNEKTEVRSVDLADALIPNKDKRSYLKELQVNNRYLLYIK